MRNERIYKPSHHKTVLLVICILTLTLNLCACDPMHDHHPYEINTEWISEDPYIRIQYGPNPGDFSERTVEFVYDGNTYDVEVYTHAWNFMICETEDSATEHTGIVGYLLSGRCKYRDGCLVVKVDEESILYGKYKEVVLKPVGTPVPAQEPRDLSYYLQLLHAALSYEME
ncbi:MAG: hypothetical protein IJO28_00325 [Oscillospiraceae bacterium]|nr:hypothetical protein [Oscillospiraceae bacterium]